jgi:hypothetical protein
MQLLEKKEINCELIDNKKIIKLMLDKIEL